MKRRIIAATLLALGLLSAAVPASAGKSQPIGGCPDSYSLTLVKNVDKSVQSTALATDINGDGFICTKPLPNPTNHFLTDLNFIDNNTPL